MNPVVASKLKSTQIGGRGSMRRKAPPRLNKNNLGAQKAFDDLMAKYGNQSKSKVANITSINFRSEKESQNLQFNFPEMNVITKAHAFIVTGKAVKPTTLNPTAMNPTAMNPTAMNPTAPKDVADLATKDKNDSEDSIDPELEAELEAELKTELESTDNVVDSTVDVNVDVEKRSTC